MINETIKSQIKARIGELEKLSALEFVPVFVPRSAQYRLFRLSLATLTLVSMLTYFLWEGWGASFYIKMSISMSLSACVYLVISHRKILGRILPKALIHEEVVEAAALKFLQNEVFSTPQRTGILIYVSELERAVFILADKGVASTQPPTKWTELGQLLAKDFKEDHPGDSFFSALEELTKLLAKDFPPHAENANDLSDEVKH